MGLSQVLLPLFLGDNRNVPNWPVMEYGVIMKLLAPLFLVVTMFLVACGGSGDSDSPNAVPGASSERGGAITFKGVTYDLNHIWCGGGRRWQSFDSREWRAGIMVRDDQGTQRYAIELDFGDGEEVWIFNPAHQPDRVEENAELVVAGDDYIRGTGFPVWPRQVTDREKQQALSEPVDFEISC